MAQIYFRTEAEFIEDDMLCADGCDHSDCAELRHNLRSICPFCFESVAGKSVFIEKGELVHAICSVRSIENSADVS